ncbi:MAG: HAD family phosphatase [Euryarchaeota archaeon]|nr:HAD family phosphatase [Euryarchaeota archaeon]MDE1835542.1 HAD family phosphatase [Euryarchaeota archaeon]MDE1879633.1 HAD family phosphatase [Euryarchaeota archaeon]MDE2043836.1 HAD family phosphatase [Thermoplasmata archaeon]
MARRSRGAGASKAERTPSPRFVVFDVGGVLIHWDDRLVMDRAARELGEPPALLQELLLRFRPPLQSGRIDLDAFWDRFAKELGRPISRAIRESWWKLLEKRARPQRAVVAWAAELRRAGLRTALFSNTEASHRRYFSRAWSRGFDPHLLSYQLRATKPSPLAFHRARARLGVPAAQICLFDDLPNNVRAAREAGWNAQTFPPIHGVPSARRYLRSLGWIP